MYYLRMQGRVTGPFTMDKMKALRARGILQPFHEISTDKANWHAASGVAELFSPLSSEPVATVASPAPVPQPQAVQGPVWFYLDSRKERCGPVDESVFPSLVSQGLFNKRTLVWSPGMPNWIEASEALPQTFYMGAVIANSGNLAAEQHSIDPSRYPPGAGMEKKNRVVAMLLAWFFGIFGVHHFYLGNTNKGLLYLVLSLFCLPLPVIAILSLIDIFVIATSKDPIFE
jgi:hypothetical protein